MALAVEECHIKEEFLAVKRAADGQQIQKSTRGMEGSYLGTILNPEPQEVVHMKRKFVARKLKKTKPEEESENRETKF